VEPRGIGPAGGQRVGALRRRDAAAPADDFAQRRARMVERLRRRGVEDARLLAAFDSVPRHLFVDEALAARAYGDGSLPIGHGQTLSQPFIVARMLARLHLRPGDKVLEVGTGSGYQAALLARLAGFAWTVERIPALAERARGNWRRAGVRDVRLRVGDGSQGWAAEAPFDAIVVAAAAPVVPPTLLAQLRPGGRMAIPVGGAFDQSVRVLERTEAGARVEEHEACRFVRLIGAEGFAE
jgi:protein-L-isoaspartate(D-aspartate) O-methyltransferase